MISEWTYFLRTVPVSEEQLTPLEEAIKLDFIPYLSGRPCMSIQERHLISLPTRLGGLGLVDPKTMTEEYARSKEVAQPMIKQISKGDYTLCHGDERSTKANSKNLDVQKKERKGGGG
jgi:hypothetical protein